MKILKLTAENIKKLKVVEITPQGNLVQITGPNGSGKSSVLDSIYYALAGVGSLPSKPVRKGTSKAVIKLDLGEVVVIRRFTEAGGTSLTVEAANGAKFPSPQKMLDDLLGELTFDPLEFTRMEPKKQLETLRGMVKLSVDIDALDAKNALDYVTRTDVNRQVKALEAQVGAIQVPESVPPQEHDIQSMLTEVEEAAGFNQMLTQERAGRAESVRKIQELRKSAAELAAKANMLEKSLPAESDEQLIDLQEITQRIELARQENEVIKQAAHRDQLVEQLHTLRAEALDLTTGINERTALKQQTIISAKMPVKGLGFGEGEVVFNSLPFTQASDAERLRISVAIAMAMNPKLRVLRIRDGSLLDDSNLELLAKMAKAGDYQIWIERVETGGKVGVVMEDGHVSESG